MPVVVLLAGFLLAASADTAAGTDLRSDRRLRLTDLIDARQRSVVEGATAARQLRAEVQEATATAAAGNTGVEADRRAAATLERPAGLTPVSGPAVTVMLDDAPRPASGGVPVPGDPLPDDLVVHERDVSSVVNALWAGGAEAMAVMGQRVVTTSAVRCVGNTLLLHGAVYSPPFTVTAIGDPDRLRAALSDSPGVRLFRDYVDAYGLGYSVSTEESELPGYDGPLQLPSVRMG